MALVEYEAESDDPYLGRKAGERMLMDTDFPIPPGWRPVVAGQAAINSSSLPRASCPSAVPPLRGGQRLNSYGERLKSEFDRYYAIHGCTCEPSTPVVCSHCSHGGNPKNLQFDDGAWELIPPRSRADDIMDAIREMAGKGNS